MKYSWLAWSIVLTLFASPSFVGAQANGPLHAHFGVIPLHPISEAPSTDDATATVSATTTVQALASPPTTASIPMWSYTTVASRDGRTYSGTMVGRSPFFHGARTTSIDAYLVPVKVTFKVAGGRTIVFDPGQHDACLPTNDLTPIERVQQSPIILPANFTMNGVEENDTQYVDAFQRANFFDAVSQSGGQYHSLINLKGALPTISLTVSSPSGGVFMAIGACGLLGVINVKTLQGTLEKLLASLASQGIGPNNFPIFLFYNVVASQGPPNKHSTPCCFLGFHDAVQSKLGSQLFAFADYDSFGDFTNISNTSILSHELAELYDDPLGTNRTPAWGNIGQVTSGCQNNLEVGDPRTGELVPPVTMPNGITYDLQELAFYSWFFGAPSIGAGGLFSNNGTFFSDAGAICH